MLLESLVVLTTISSFSILILYLILTTLMKFIGCNLRIQSIRGVPAYILLTCMSRDTFFSSKMDNSGFPTGIVYGRCKSYFYIAHINMSMGSADREIVDIELFSNINLVETCKNSDDNEISAYKVITLWEYRL